MVPVTPAVVNDITKQWVEEILTGVHGTSLKVKTISVCHANEKGDNFASTLAAVEVKTENEQEFNIMVKLAPQDYMKRQLFEDALMFEKEAFAYIYLIKDFNEYQQEKLCKIQIPLPFPKCFYVKKEEDGRAVIVLENLNKEGFRMLDKMKEIDYPHALTALLGLSKFHAVSFAMKKDNNIDYITAYPWIKRSLFGDMAGMNEVFENIFDPVISVLQGIPGTENYVEKLKGYQETADVHQRYKELSAPKEPMALVTHGDFWNNNMMFRYSNGSAHPIDCKIFDLQLCRYSMAAVDLVFFVYTSTTEEFREKHLNQLLWEYYNSFMHCLKTLQVDFDSSNYSFDHLVKDFDERVELGFIMASYLVPMIMCKKEQLPNYDDKSEEEIKVIRKNWYQKLKANGSKKLQFRALDLVKEMYKRNII